MNQLRQSAGLAEAHVQVAAPAGAVRQLWRQLDGSRVASSGGLDDEAGDLPDGLDVGDLEAELREQEEARTNDRVRARI